eukprot:TRINITY_DN4817_c0_g1_i2.p1 TRINITY_DN4817_c0_g1~~TRINITY_DN4817_c0_g1_i2.p1  ORF type:complete len:350 (-),score=59.41 TRINITY_DN4817_c0_g1_i2:198-1247(-)
MKVPGIFVDCLYRYKMYVQDVTLNSHSDVKITTEEYNFEIHKWLLNCRSHTDFHLEKLETFLRKVSKVTVEAFTNFLYYDNISLESIPLEEIYITWKFACDTGYESLANRMRLFLRGNQNRENYFLHFQYSLLYDMLDEIYPSLYLFHRNEEILEELVEFNPEIVPVILQLNDNIDDFLPDEIHFTSSYYQDLEDILDKRMYYDVELKVQDPIGRGKLFQLHRSILASHSTFFSILLSSNSGVKVEHTSDIPLPVFEKMINYFYFHNVQWDLIDLIYLSISFPLYGFCKSLEREIFHHLLIEDLWMNAKNDLKVFGHTQLKNFKRSGFCPHSKEKKVKKIIISQKKKHK